MFRYEVTFSIKALLVWLFRTAVAAAVLAGLAYGCAQIVGWEWLNPIRAFGILYGVFVLTLTAKAVRWAFGEPLVT